MVWGPVQSNHVLPVTCFWVSVESVSLSSCRALAIPPQSWTSILLYRCLNTRFLRAPAAAWFTAGLGLRSRDTRVGTPPRFKTCDRHVEGKHSEAYFLRWQHCEHLQTERTAKSHYIQCSSSFCLKAGYAKVFWETVCIQGCMLMLSSSVSSLLLLCASTCSDLLFCALLFETGMLNEGSATQLVTLLLLRQVLYSLLQGQLWYVHPAVAGTGMNEWWTYKFISELMAAFSHHTWEKSLELAESVKRGSELTLTVLTWML